MITFQIPSHAIQVTYRGEGKAIHVYHFWYTGSEWAWSALGNCGEEESSDKAQEAARVWVRDGVKSLTPFRKEFNNPKGDY